MIVKLLSLLYLEELKTKTHLKEDEMSRNMYLFFPTNFTNASSFRLTIRSQMTTSFFT